MKLKLVVASMSILGLVSCPVLAANTTTNTTTPTPKHHHHHHHAKKVAEQEVQKDYKDYKDMPVCTLSPASLVLDSMTQNVGRSLPNPCNNEGWTKRIQLSGGINFDIGKFGNRNANIMGENYQRFSLNDVYLNVGATINDWVHAFASVSYNTATVNNPSFAGVSATDKPAEYDAGYSNNVTSGSSNFVEIEQAFATLGNFDVSPFFVQVGKQFQDFSRYEIHPITLSMTQVMSEVLATSLRLGFIADGFNGSLYAFDDPINKSTSSSTSTNYGIALGYEVPSDELGWDIGAAYLYNLIGANNVAYNVVEDNGGLSQYNTRVGGAAVYADVNSGPFSLGARYTAAVQRFNVIDLPKNLAATTGAKPWAFGIQAGYGFDAFFGVNQLITLGYQASGESAYLQLPKSRWELAYGIDLYKNTTFTLQWDHDSDYSVSNGGSNNNTNLVSIRTSVQFG